MCSVSLRPARRCEMSRFRIPHHPGKNRYPSLPPSTHCRIYPLRRAAEAGLGIGGEAEEGAVMARRIYSLAADEIDLSSIFAR
jgi:hypothetical protein